MIRTISAACVINLFLLVQTVSAHFLWLTVDSKTGKLGTTNLYFEEGPGPGDGQYLDPFVKRGTTWIRTIKANKPQSLKMTEVKKPGKRWLSAELPAARPRSVDSYGKWGVYRYGKGDEKIDVLLHYHARNLDVRTADQLETLNRAKQLNLDLVPRLVDDSLEVKVLWKGKPATGRPLIVRGPVGLRQNLTTGEDGVARFKLADRRGRYTLRTNVEEDRSGTDDGKKYDKVRHHCTLTITLPLRAQVVVTTPGSLPNNERVPVSAPDNPLVDLRSVLVSNHGNEAVVMVRFFFKGEVRPTNRIELTVTAMDGTGAEIGTAKTICTDGRYLAQTMGSGGATRTLRRVEYNCPSLLVPLSANRQVSRVNLRFQQV